MRRFLMWLGLSCWLVAAVSAHAGTGRVMKVLPHFLDLKGRHALSPSLYDRDAYQAYLREHPEQRSAIRFDVQWKLKSAAYSPLKLRLELRGIAKAALPKEFLLEQSVDSGGWF